MMRIHVVIRPWPRIQKSSENSADRDYEANVQVHDNRGDLGKGEDRECEYQLDEKSDRKRSKNDQHTNRPQNLPEHV